MHNILVKFWQCGNDVLAVAEDEDHQVITSHVSSDLDFATNDILRKHHQARMAERYPHGYQVVFDFNLRDRSPQA